MTVIDETKARSAQVEAWLDEWAIYASPVALAIAARWGMTGCEDGHTPDESGRCREWSKR